ncbi:MAG TPA: tetratricopeptide repeat protein, partial [Acetobacteraceae bacterium]|nr:tetratricopeptide repeat protein [Acetobacteraceae bacterium]
MSVMDRFLARFSPKAALRHGMRLSEKGAVKRAFPLLSRAAQAGLAEAEYRVGRCYLEGAGVPVSRSEGARWLERAAGHGFVEAQALLATLYLHGLAAEAAGSDPGSAANLFTSNTSANPPDFVGAEKWARRASEGGSAEGQALLGYILTSGPESMRNLPEAFQWYERSARANCAQGHLGYALSLSNDATTPDKQKKVTEHLRAAADAGLPTALYLLGMIAERGLGVAADLPAAIDYYRQAAEKGHRSAQARWGVALLEGRGVEANPTEGES